jgi:hypothetical protein
MFLTALRLALVERETGHSMLGTVTIDGAQQLFDGGLLADRSGGSCQAPVGHGLG